MKLCNNTRNEVFYSITSPGSGDCGTIDPGDSTELDDYDNKPGVQVAFQVRVTTKNVQPPFTVTIPASGTGMAVTIGLYSE